MQKVFVLSETLSQYIEKFDMIPRILLHQETPVSCSRAATIHSPVFLLSLCQSHLTLKSSEPEGKEILSVSWKNTNMMLSRLLEVVMTSVWLGRDGLCGNEPPVWPRDLGSRQ